MNLYNKKAIKNIFYASAFLSVFNNINTMNIETVIDENGIELNLPESKSIDIPNHNKNKFYVPPKKLSQYEEQLSSSINDDRHFFDFPEDQIDRIKRNRKKLEEKNITNKKLSNTHTQKEINKETKIQKPEPEISPKQNTRKVEFEHFVMNIPINNKLEKNSNTNTLNTRTKDIFEEFNVSEIEIYEIINFSKILRDKKKQELTDKYYNQDNDLYTRNMYRLQLEDTKMIKTNLISIIKQICSDDYESIVKTIKNINEKKDLLSISKDMFRNLIRIIRHDPSKKIIREFSITDREFLYLSKKGINFSDLALNKELLKRLLDDFRNNNENNTICGYKF
jgi:hypothetical protein